MGPKIRHPPAFEASCNDLSSWRRTRVLQPRRPPACSANSGLVVPLLSRGCFRGPRLWSLEGHSSQHRNRAKSHQSNSTADSTNTSEPRSSRNGHTASRPSNIEPSQFSSRGAPHQSSGVHAGLRPPCTADSLVTEACMAVE